jgi:ketosteroid isomerase-like protein
MPEHSERLLRRYYQTVWIEGRLGALDELLAEDYYDHDPPPGFGHDRTAARHLAQTFVAGLHDPCMTIVALVATTDAAAAHWRLRWTQQGPLLGDPAFDGHRLVMRGADLIRVADGRITDIYHTERLHHPATAP